MMRKVLYFLLLLVASIGLVLCAGGVIGVWLVNTPATDAVTAAAQTAESYLALADNTTATANSEIESLRVQLETIGTRVEGMTPETRAAVADEVSNSVQTRFGPTVGALRTTFTTLRAGIIALNQSLESANRIPGVNVPTLTDELQTADQKLEAIGRSLDEIRIAVSDVTIDGSAIQTQIAATTERLASFEGMLSQWRAQIAAAIAAIAATSEAAPGVIDLTSLLLSILLILFGAGQLCLILRSIGALRA